MAGLQRVSSKGGELINEAVQGMQARFAEEMGGGGGF
jgi:hypothetical protein